MDAYADHVEIPSCFAYHLFNSYNPTLFASYHEGTKSKFRLTKKIKIK